MRIIFAEDLAELPTLDWLLKDWIPSCSFGMIWGKQESFKSFVGLSIACAVASGKPWMGVVPVGDPGGVCYVAAEGQRGIRARIDAWGEANKQNVPRKRFGIVANPMLFDEVEDTMQSLDERGLAPRLVVVDTWSRCLAGGEENNNGEAERALFQLDKFRQKYESSVLIIHHCDKVGQWPRGAYALRCAMDYEYQVVREEGSMVCNVVCRKMKDAERPRSVTLLARQVKESLVLERT